MVAWPPFHEGIREPSTGLVECFLTPCGSEISTLLLTESCKRDKLDCRIDSLSNFPSLTHGRSLTIYSTALVSPRLRLRSKLLVIFNGAVGAHMGDPLLSHLYKLCRSWSLLSTGLRSVFVHVLGVHVRPFAGWLATPASSTFSNGLCFAVIIRSRY